METSIDVSFTGGKKLTARVGNNTITTDVPAQIGGNGTAPAPFTLFLTSIATCAGLYALNFCEARNIPTDNMALSMRYDFDLKTKRCETLTIDLTLPTGFPQEYQKAIIKAMDRCTVKQHMVNPPEFIMNTI
jgi:uncharacterized OsmC-like protein